MLFISISKFGQIASENPISQYGGDQFTHTLGIFHDTIYIWGSKRVIQKIINSTNYTFLESGNLIESSIFEFWR